MEKEKLRIFQYTNGYDFDEFRIMCDRFRGVWLPFLGGYDVNCLLAEYIFGYSMKRFPVGRKHTFRRFLGGMFLYPVRAEGKTEVKEGRKKSGTAFVFTGDGAGRPDYVECIRKVKKQCDGSVLYLMDRSRPRFCITHMLSFFTEFLWAVFLNRNIHDFNISFDMAVSVYRAKKQGEMIYRKLKRNHAAGIVTFCDAWNIENVIARKAWWDGIPTATLQHGNGTEIMYGSCSDFYLTNSRLSRENCIHAGIPEKKTVLAGPAKYAGERFGYKAFTEIANVGVVFDGAQNFQNNVDMIQVIHKALEGTDIRCCIRFHPNNKREDYQPYLLDGDEIYDDLSEFEKDMDICIVYNSSMYTDMIYKKIPVYRFKNGKVDLFPELNDKGFADSAGLKAMLADMTENRDKYVKEQEMLYDQVFGAACRADSYKKFFDKKFR